MTNFTGVRSKLHYQQEFGPFLFSVTWGHYTCHLTKKGTKQRGAEDPSITWTNALSNIVTKATDKCVQSPSSLTVTQRSVCTNKIWTVDWTTRNWTCATTCVHVMDKPFSTAAELATRIHKICCPVGISGLDLHVCISQSTMAWGGKLKCCAGEGRRRSVGTIK